MTDGETVKTEQSDWNWTVPPGYTIAEELMARGLSVRELGLACGILPADAQGLVEGWLELTEELAVKLHAMLGVSVQFWLNLEKSYRDALARGIPMPEDGPLNERPWHRKYNAAMQARRVIGLLGKQGVDCEEPLICRPHLAFIETVEPRAQFSVWTLSPGETLADRDPGNAFWKTQRLVRPHETVEIEIFGKWMPMDEDPLESVRNGAHPDFVAGMIHAYLMTLKAGNDGI